MRIINDVLNHWRQLDRHHRLRLGYFLIALLATAIAWNTLDDKTKQLERKRAVRESDLNELLQLRSSYRRAKISTDSLTSRMSMARSDNSPAAILEEIGLKGKNVRVSSLKSEERNGYLEDMADAKIDGLTANEAINLLYQLENKNRPIALKKAHLRVRFDDPSRFDLTITMVLLKPLPDQNG